MGWLFSPAVGLLGRLRYAYKILVVPVVLLLLLGFVAKAYVDLQIQSGQSITPDAVKVFVRERIGSVKTPKQVEIWPDLPRSKVGKVLKNEIKAQLLSAVNDAASRHA